MSYKKTNKQYIDIKNNNINYKQKILNFIDNGKIFEKDNIYKEVKSYFDDNNFSDYYNTTFYMNCFDLFENFMNTQFLKTTEEYLKSENYLKFLNFYEDEIKNNVIFEQTITNITNDNKKTYKENNNYHNIYNTICLAAFIIIWILCLFYIINIISINVFENTENKIIQKIIINFNRYFTHYIFEILLFGLISIGGIISIYLTMNKILKLKEYNVIEKKFFIDINPYYMNLQKFDNNYKIYLKNKLKSYFYNNRQNFDLLKRDYTNFLTKIIINRNYPDYFIQNIQNYNIDLFINTDKYLDYFIDLFINEDITNYYNIEKNIIINDDIDKFIINISNINKNYNDFYIIYEQKYNNNIKYINDINSKIDIYNKNINYGVNEGVVWLLFIFFIIFICYIYYIYNDSYVSVVEVFNNEFEAKKYYHVSPLFILLIYGVYYTVLYFDSLTIITDYEYI